MTTHSLQRKPVAMDNLVAGALADLLKICSLGQPFKVLKTHMGVERRDSLQKSCQVAWSRGGVRGLYQGLWPWGVFECTTKGAVLQVTASEVSYQCSNLGMGPAAAGGCAGMAGGIVQSYTTMGVTTFMTTIEVTRAKGAAASGDSKGTMTIAKEIVKRDGVLGMYRGVHALALRQMTNWGSRFGISRWTQQVLDWAKGRESGSTEKRKPWEKIFASCVGGALACWNNPIEVIRVEQQKASTVQSGEFVSFGQATKEIWVRDGFRGFYRGVVPRVALGVWATVAQVAGCDQIREYMDDWRARDQ